MKINQDLKTIQFNEYCIAYNNLEAATQTIEEVFGESPYYFSSNTDSPLIIDAGSNIGISVLFFKKYYPNARLICFEPDLSTYIKLSENVQVNHIENVRLINAALSAHQAEVDFFGQMFVESPDVRGNSILSAWGMQRTTNHSTKVKAIQLSPYITERVDFLKLDIEGAEQQVLEELEKANKLGFIQQTTIEVHESHKIAYINNLDSIVSLLKRNKFRVHVTEKMINSLLPKEIEQWQKEVNPRFFMVKAAHYNLD